MSINRRIGGTHFEGPLLGSDRSNRGLFEDIPLASVDCVRSPYDIYVEQFHDATADGELTTAGWTVTDINTPTAPSETMLPEDNFLLLNPGTKVDSGVQIQKILLPANLGVVNCVQVLGPITSTATLMDAREIFFQVRLGMSTNLVTANDGKFLLGWFTTDTSLLSSTTGLPTVAAGGGFGFHKGETGAITALCSPDAIVAAGTATGVNALAATTVNVKDWYVLGARMRVIDASDSTGVCDFYINGSRVATIANTTCMDSTEEFAFSFAYQNGPVQIQDYALNYIITGITKPGLAYPYTTGTW
jgi:hypothetical protein